MGELTSETFADWLHPSDVIDHYLHLGEAAAKVRVSAMLRDGLLRAATPQLIINGRDHGLSLIPRELWNGAIYPGLWSTGLFRIKAGNKTVSAYEVRIDRDIQTLPTADREAEDAAPTQPASKRPLPEKRFKAWLDLFLAAHAQPTEDAARASLNALFPDNTVTRERLREALPERRKGRPGKRQEGE